MAKTRMILFRVTQSQYERIQNNAQAKGHTSVASYLRYTALDKDLVFEKRFNDMYKVIVGFQIPKNKN
ncbi:hypothetical protein ACFL3V_03670 [Nanoarchaeota archaeon]